MSRTEIRGGQITDASVNLTADVTGTLPIANGGNGTTTGISTATQAAIDTKVTADGILVVKKLTQAAYDALGGGVVSTTLYVIVG